MTDEITVRKTMSLRGVVCFTAIVLTMLLIACKLSFLTTMSWWIAFLPLLIYCGCWTLIILTVVTMWIFAVIAVIHENNLKKVKKSIDK